jgi:PAS domain S-box-containing protein
MTTPIRVLILEDQAADAELILNALRQAGFNPDWQRVTTEPDFLAALDSKTDLVLADWTLPQFSGLRALQLRNECGLDTPFIIVSDSIDDEAVVEAMRHGASDYLLKDRLARLGQAIKRAMDDRQLRSERRKAEADVARLNRLYLTISQINETIVHAQDRDSMFAEICRVAIEHGKFRMAWIGLVDLANGYVRPITHAGEEQGYLANLTIAIDDPKLGGGPTGSAIREGRCIICQDIANDPRMAPWRETALERGFRSSAAVPIRQKNSPIGALTVYASEPHAFCEEDRELLNKIGLDISFAIDSMDSIIERKRAEAALRDSERRFSTIFQASPVGIFFSRVSDGKLLETNQAFLDLIGYSREEVIDRSSLELNTWVAPEESSQNGKGLTRDEKVSNSEIKIRKNSGQISDSLVSSELIDLGGEQYRLSMVTDITDRKRSERLLQTHNDDLLLMNALNKAVNRGENVDKIMEVFTTEIEGMFPDCRGAAIYLLDSNASYLEMRSLTISTTTIEKIEKLIGRPISKIKFPIPESDIWKKILSTENGTLVSDPKSIREWINRFAGFEILPVVLRDAIQRLMPQIYQLLGIHSVILVPLYSKARVFGLLGVASERLLIEEDLKRIQNISNQVAEVILHRQAEEKLHLQGAALEASANTIVITDNTGLIVWANPAFAQLTGFDPKEAVGRNPGELIKSGEQDQEFYKSMWQTILSGKVWHGELVNRRKDGSLYPEEMTITPVYGQTGKIINFIAVKRDVSERKQAEEVLARQTQELRERNEELARLYRASGSLLSGASSSLQELAETIVGIIQREFGQANCSLLLVQRDSNQLQRLAAIGPYTEQVMSKTLTLDGPGLVPQAIRSGQTVNVGDVHTVQGYLPNWESAMSEMAVPLKIGNDVIGVIDTQSALPNAFNKQDEGLMTIFAERAALALEHSRLYEQTEGRVQQLAALRTVDMAISSSFDIHLTLDILLDQVRAQLGVHAADILGYNQVTQTFWFSCGQGFRTHALQHTHLRLGEGYAGKAAMERRLLKVPDLHAEPSGFGKSPLLVGENFISYAGIPLVAKGQIKGVLEVFHREPLDLTADQQSFLEILAGQAGIAMDNAELYEHQQRSIADLTIAYNDTLEGWASALELRDKETEGHTRRVTDLTIRLARALGVSEADQVQIYRGALLHDIGKIGVPDAVVLKPGPLTEAEWELMRRHPQYAYNMLSPIGYLSEALNIPYCHHEKWDGTGYPRGLKGEEIPLAARLFSVVDVWDALTSDRPYRQAWTHEKAKLYIQEQAGTQFEPKIVEAFLRELLAQ